MPTLRELRLAVADRLAPAILGTTGLEVGPGVYTGAAIVNGAVSRRRIVSSDLVAMNVAGTDAENPADYVKDEWVYLRLNPPELRRIPEGGFGGYAPASEVATGYGGPEHDADEIAYIDVERSFSLLVPSGTAFEIHAIPPLRAGRQAGTHHAINRALRVILREDSVAVPGVTGQYRYDVTATFPWLTNPNLFLSAHYTETIGSVDTYAIPGARLRFDANVVYLLPNTSITTGQTFPVRVLRPLATWIKVGGVWGESTVGLVDDADECLGDLDAISLVAAFHVAEAQAGQCVVGSAEQQWWLAHARAFASRSPFLRDQRKRTPVTGAAWPDNIAVSGPFSGRWGPQFR